MSRKPRPILRFFLIALLILLVPVFVLATTVAATGTITVKVHEPSEDLDLFIPVPALLVDLALFAAPYVIPAEELAEVRREIDPYREAIRSVADELEDCPDAVLVEVKSDREQVRISKKGRSFHIDVDSADGDVEVKVPARLLGRALSVI